MNKPLKYSLIGLGGLVVLVIVAVAVFALTFDANRYKPQIEQLVKEKTGRTLQIKGPLEVAVFPTLGAKVAGITLSEHAAEREFLALDSAHASVALLPLLRGQVIVDHIRVSGLKANVIKEKDGKFNFSDLLQAKNEPSKPAPPQPDAKKGGQSKEGGAVAFDIAGIDVDRSSLTYHDLASGQEIALTDLKLSTGRIGEKADGKLVVHVTAKGQKPDVDLKLDISSTYRVDLAAGSYSIAKLDAKLSGAAAGITGLDAKITAPEIVIAKDKAHGKAIEAELKMKQGTHDIQAKLKIDGIEGSAKALSVPKLSADLQVAGPDLPMKSFKIPVTGSVHADLEKQTANAELTSKFDETNLQAKLGLTKFSPPAYVFDISGDKLNVDRYFPPEKKEVVSTPAPPEKEKPAPQAEKKPAPDTPVDLSALKDLNATGKLQMGFLQVRGIKVSNLKADVKAAGGRLDLPHTANLYEGSVNGALVAEHDGRIAMKETMQGIAIGPLLRDAAEKDLLEGKGNVSLDVNAAGKSVNAFKKSLAGSAKMNLKDGSIKGIDIAAVIRRAREALGGQLQEAAKASTEKTDFSEMSASFAIKNGVAHNEDLDVKAPLFRIGGRGDIDIGNGSLDYTTKATVVATTKGQGGAEVGQLSGLTVPVHLSGPFDAMKYDVDYRSVATDVAKSKLGEAVKDKLKERLGGQGSTSGGTSGNNSTGEAIDKLRGIFGR